MQGQLDQMVAGQRPWVKLSGVKPIRLDVSNDFVIW
jgi:hypothetical protein